MIDRTVWFEWLQMDFSGNPDDPRELLCLPEDFLTFWDSFESPDSSSTHPLASLLASDEKSELTQKLDQLHQAAIRRRLAVRKVRPGEHREAWKMLLAAIDEAEKTLARQLQTTAISVHPYPSCEINHVPSSPSCKLSTEASGTRGLSEFLNSSVTPPTRTIPPLDPIACLEAMVEKPIQKSNTTQTTTTIPPRSFRILEDEEAISDAESKGSRDQITTSSPSSPNPSRNQELREILPNVIASPSSGTPAPAVMSNGTTSPKISRRKFVWTARLCMLVLLASTTCGAWWYREYLLESSTSSVSAPTVISSHVVPQETLRTPDSAETTNASSQEVKSSQTGAVKKEQIAETNAPLDQELSQIPTPSVDTVQSTNARKSEISDNLSPVEPVTPTPPLSDKPRTWEFADEDETPSGTGFGDETVHATNLDEELRTIRGWMRERKYTEAATRLDTLIQSATGQEAYNRIDRIRFWNKNLQSFWKTVHEIAGRLKPLEELPVRGTVMLVVSSSADELVLRVDGTRKAYPPYSYPQIVVNALVLRGFEKSDDSLFLTASFLAADTRGEPDTAREILFSLQKKGYAPATELLQTLDDPCNSETEK
ncbi:MAG: hypothetical protein PHE53_03875 [Thermoguttaceae bacterium]|nr:hypothetical protein [Thermoguttaceae bacterium]